MRYIKEWLISIGLVLILIFLMDPFSIYYSNMMLTSTITVLILLFVFFSIFVWKDVPKDEREEIHQSRAGRVAFLSGTIVMLVGIITQSTTHNIDVWLVLALVAMILGKLVTLKLSGRNN
ncbi:MAG: putative membrane protein [Candidatus Paceibacteria bacterium]|jgi:uncharacterized membrane protein